MNKNTTADAMERDLKELEIKKHTVTNFKKHEDR